MGQYHVLVNLDKKEIVTPHGLGLGLKQWEHLGEFNGTLADAMYLLVMTSPASGGGDFPSTGQGQKVEAQHSAIAAHVAQRGGGLLRLQR
jgi:hypothetical protein